MSTDTTSTLISLADVTPGSAIRFIYDSSPHHRYGVLIEYDGRRIVMADTPDAIRDDMPEYVESLSGCTPNDWREINANLGCQFKVYGRPLNFRVLEVIAEPTS